MSGYDNPQWVGEAEQAVSAMTHFMNPSREQWLAIRPKFTQLYYVEGKTLQEVRDQLKAEDDGFWASDPAFRRKITEWNLRRRYSAAEKDAMCQHATKSAYLACDRCSDLMRQQPMTPRKFQRHKAARRKEWAHRGVLIPLPALTDSVQSILRATQDLWLYQVGSAAASGWNGEWCDMSMITHLVDTAIFLRNPRDLPLAESRMVQFCHALNDGIVFQPIGVLLAIMEMILNPKWQAHPKTQVNLFRSARKLILARKNVNLCLYQIFHKAQTPDTLKGLGFQLVLMQTQTLLSNFKDHMEELFYLLEDGILDLIHCRQFSEALRLALAIPKFNDLSHQRQCEVTALISRCQLESGAYHEAIVGGDQVIRHCEPFVASRNESYAYIYINTCDVLARCFAAIDDISTVVAYRNRAYTAALDIFGTQASNTVYHRAELNRFKTQLELQQRPLPAVPAFLLLTQTER